MFQTRSKWTIPAVVTIAVLSNAVPSVIAQTPADNTKINTRDRVKSAVTADQQKNDVADRELTQKIRRALMRDKALSSYAHNVKVIAQDGHVTLKGPVRSDEEKQRVASKAEQIAGADHVTNEISVAPAGTKSAKK